MSISIVCPSCQQKLKAPDAGAGRKLKCPKCGKSISIPAQTGASAKSSALTRTIPVEQNAEDLAAFLSEKAGNHPSRPCYSVEEPQEVEDDTPPLAPTPWLSRSEADFSARQESDRLKRSSPGKLIWAAIGLVTVALSVGAFSAIRSMPPKRATSEGEQIAEQKRGEKITPLESFRSLVTKVRDGFGGYRGESVHSAVTASELPFQNAEISFMYDNSVSISYDVQKSNSLATPYTGNINFGLIKRIQGITREMTSHGFVVQPYGIGLICHSIENCSAWYAYQDEKWILSEMRLTCTVFSFEPTKNQLVDTLWGMICKDKGMIGGKASISADDLANNYPLLMRVLQPQG